MNTQPTKDPRPVLKPDALYLGDNGRCFCGKHAGCSALYTGRDISGQKVMECTPAALRAAGEDPAWIRCETCDAIERKGVRA